MRFLLFAAFLAFSTLHSATWKWDNRTIFYMEKGQGDRHILLLHGFAANTYTWHNQVDLLEKKGYHVWAPDFLGFGGSDKPCEVAYSLRLYRDQILSFMQAHNIPKAHIVGHSMGGAVALAIAVHAPDKVRSLVLIDSAGYPLRLPLHLFIGKQCKELVPANLPPFFTKAAIRLALMQIFYDSSRIQSEQVEAYWKPYTQAGAVQCSFAILQAFNNADFQAQKELYKNITAPTLIVWGEQDTWIPLRYQQRMKNDITHAQTVLISSCGHAPQEECPAKFNAPFIDFLSQN